MANRELKITVVGDSASAERALKRTAGATERIGPSAKVAQNSLDAVTSALTSRLGPASGIAKSALDKVGLSAIASGGALQAGLVGGALAGGAALTAFAVKGVSDFIRLAGEVRNFQRASGASAEEASRFVAVLDDMEIEADKGATAIFKLAKTASTNAASLDKVGITVARAKDGTAELTETLLNAADAYAAQPDPAKRAEIAFAAFGKQGLSLVPILEKGRKGLEEFFASAEDTKQILSQEDIDSAREYELAMDELGDATTMLSRELGKGLVPVLASVATGLAKSIEGIEEFVGWVQKAAASSTGFDEVGKELEKRGVGLRAFFEAAEAAGEDASEAQGEFADATGQVTEELDEERRATDEQTKALDELLRATSAQFNSQIAYERSLDSLEDAQAKVTEATKAQTEAVRLHGARSAEAGAATEGLSRAQLDARSAFLSVAEAAARQAEAQAKAAGTVLTESEKYNVYRDRLIQLKDTLVPGSSLRLALEGYIDQLKTVPKVVDTRLELRGPFTREGRPDFVGPLPSAKTKKGTNRARGHGGPVTAGMPYVVGDAGRPELFVPDVNGTVLPRVPPGTGAGPVTFNITVNMPPGSDGEDVVAALRRYQLRNGRVPIKVA